MFYIYTFIRIYIYIYIYTCVYEINKISLKSFSFNNKSAQYWPVELDKPKMIKLFSHPLKSV